MKSADLSPGNKNDAVVLEHFEDVALLRLNRPENRNALSLEIKMHLETMIPALMNDAAVRCIVITGTADSFCAGGDITNMTERQAPAVCARMHRNHAWSKMIITGEKPVIAAVNGAAAGAGFSIALLCDIIIVSDKAHFQPAFSKLGAVPDLGLALTLPRSIGALRAREILLTNRRIGASEAVSIGLAARVVKGDDLLAEALKIARDLAASSATALALTKMLANSAYESIEQFLRTEAFAQATAFGSAEFAEGVAAFLGKRPADFKGAS